MIEPIKLTYRDMGYDAGMLRLPFEIDVTPDMPTNGIRNAKIRSLEIDKITAGQIISKIFNLAVEDGQGDSFFSAGKTDFTNTESGFILGIDDSDSDTPKFYIGNATEYLNWNGVNLILGSDTGIGLELKITGGKISFTALGVEKGFIRTAGGSDGIVLASPQSVFFTDLLGLPNAELDSISNLKFSNDAYISWKSGRRITATAATIDFNSTILVAGDVALSAGKKFQIGTTPGINYADANVNTFSINIVGGIVTQFTKNS